MLAGESISLDDQLAQWEERKAAEKTRNSSMDDVPTGQPALALAQKVIDRVSQSGLPADLIPAAITSVAVSTDGDAENELRTAVLEFMDTVRTVEKAIAADRRGEDVPEELDIASLGVITEEEWRAFWPSADEPEPVDPVEEDEPVEPAEEDSVDDAVSDADVSTNGVEPVEEDEPVEQK